MTDIHRILKQYWGHHAFRPLQEDIIRSVLDGRDTVALLPTGGGKSVCFQVPALALEGVCVVVSPLIALMKDQVENLKKRGVPAAALYSGMTRRTIDITLDNCRFGSVRFLYVSPERLRTELFIERFKQMKVSLLAVDEAHCISQWGYDFRPPYLEIARLRDLAPGVPFMALTATATPEVRADIIEKLALRAPAVFAGSFARANLSYSVFEREDKERKLLEVLQNVPGPAVVYVRSRRRTQETAEWLARQGIRAQAYHAGLAHEERAARQDNWLENRTRVMVATNAFGMGIDKPDVRTVVHLDMPATLENYYQEAGRAGRDGRKAYAVALFHATDLTAMRQELAQAYPAVETLRQVYQALANYFQVAAGGGLLAAHDFDFEHFCRTYKLPAAGTFQAMRRLEEEGFIQLTEAFYQPSRIWLQVDKKGLYEFQVANAAYDPLLKTLLRMYGGDVFAMFVPISEKKLAGYLQTDETAVANLLAYLHQCGLLLYEKQRDKPQFLFTTVRHEAARLPLDVPQLTWRRQRDTDKLEALIRYATDGRRCRTLQLTAYFGEKAGPPCGICDVCVQNRKRDQAPDLAAYQRRLLELLDARPRLLTDLVRHLTVNDEETVLELLRDLADRKEISLLPDGTVKRN